MKEKYKKLKNKMAFCEMVAGKLNLKTDYIVHSFTIDRIPKTHSGFIERALEVQIKFDKKVEEMQEEINESLIV